MKGDMLDNVSLNFVNSLLILFKFIYQYYSSALQDYSTWTQTHIHQCVLWQFRRSQRHRRVKLGRGSCESHHQLWGVVQQSPSAPRWWWHPPLLLCGAWWCSSVPVAALRWKVLSTAWPWQQCPQTWSWETQVTYCMNSAVLRSWLTDQWGFKSPNHYVYYFRNTHRHFWKMWTGCMRLVGDWLTLGL